MSDLIDDERGRRRSARRTASAIRDQTHDHVFASKDPDPILAVGCLPLNARCDLESTHIHRLTMYGYPESRTRNGAETPGSITALTAAFATYCK